MVQQTPSSEPERAPLSVERIVAAAAAVADTGGLAAVSMRNVAKELGVEAMSLYHHISGKAALLDALADWVYAQIEPPVTAAPWRTSVQRHAASTRAVLTAHPWSLGLVDTTSSPGQAVLQRHDSLIGCFRAAGFSVPLAAHAISVVDAYVYGFALTERNLPFDPATGATEFATTIEVPWEQYPHLGEMVRELISDEDYSFSAEFEVGLGIVLDALEQRLAA